MPDKKLTDSEIVKALEIFVNSVGKGFVFANVDIKKDGVNEFKHIDLSFDEIFDLINRLQAENEQKDKNYIELLKTSSERAVIIGEQGAEIERLKTENKLLIDNDVRNKYPNCVLVEKGRIYTRTLEDYDELIGDISAEAYKELAERLRSKAKKTTITYVTDTSIREHETGWIEISLKDFDNLLKELGVNRI